MTLSAGRLDVLCGKDGLFPRQRAAMRFFHGGCGALPAMTDSASELIEIVGDHWMLAVGLCGDIGEAGFLESDMTTRATIRYSKIGKPDLLDPALKVPLQRVRLAAIADHAQVAVLIVPPLAEEVFCRSNRHGGQKHHADDAEGAHAVSE